MAAFKGSEVVAEEADAPAKPSDYHVVDNLRLVRPYYFDFKCFVKQRWSGMTLVELFSQEFPMLTREYYTRAFHAGRLRVEGRPDIGLDTPLLTGMCVRHLIHRHEPPVLAGDVPLLAVNEDFVAVCKPACMPVHVVGQYRKNTVMGVMQAQHPELGTLYPTFRLDKPVSGLLVLARSSASASRMRQVLEQRECSKSYLARVQGDFPEADAVRAAAAPPSGDAGCTELPGAVAAAAARCASLPGVSVSDGEPPWITVDVPLSWDAQFNHVTAVPAVDAAAAAAGTVSGTVPAGGGDDACGAGPSTSAAQAQTVSDPRSVGSGRKDSKRSVGRGKGPQHAVTDIRLVHTDGHTSVVECFPRTGRTHQIRVHLQYLGHPIANDTQYGGTFGPPLAFRRGRERTTTTGDALPHAKRPRAISSLDDGGSSRPDVRRDAAERQPQAASPSSAAALQTGAPSHPSHGQQPDLIAAFGGHDPLSSRPGEGRPLLTKEIQQLYDEPRFRVRPDEEEPVCPHCPCLVPHGYPIDLEPLWLHALKYSGPDWAFEAPAPNWAQKRGWQPPVRTGQNLILRDQLPGGDGDAGDK